jgi:hypothetical protein
MDGNILFLDTGKTINGLDYVNTIGGYQFYKKFKIECRNGEIVCAKCKQKIRATARDKIKYISHVGKGNNVKDKCNNFAYATSSVRLMRTAIYFGEGTLHQELKNELLILFQKNNSFNNIVGETFVYSECDKYANGVRKRRKPDISGGIHSIPVAIELQLSYQLDVDFFGREVFYKTNKSFLMWILYNVRPVEFTESEKVIFYNSNENAFVVTEETRAKSRQEGKLYFHCFYNSFENNEIIKKEKVISVDDITFDTNNYKVYYVDTELQRLEWEKQEAKRQKELFLNSLDREFTYFKTSFKIKKCDNPYTVDGYYYNHLLVLKDGEYKRDKRWFELVGFKRTIKEIKKIIYESLVN